MFNDDITKKLSQAYIGMYEKKEETTAKEEIAVCEECGKVHEGSCAKEELKGGQKKLDIDKDGDIEADDLAALRAKAKAKK